MFPAPFKVVLDANVLYPAALRDTLLRAAAMGLYQMYWTDEILDEVCRNLVTDEEMSLEQATRLRTEMITCFDEAMVIDFASLIPSMPNDAKDRHVAAAAVRSGAQVIVTINLRDFAQLPAGIEAKSPDEFLCDLFDLNPSGFVDLLRAQAAALKNPPISFGTLLNHLKLFAPTLVTECVAEVLRQTD